MTRPVAYVEHVALHVHDIRWHIRFFREVLGLTLREVQGPADAPRQAWTLGGLQFIATPGFQEPESPQARLAHLGLMCEDQVAAIAAAAAHGATALPAGPNWLRLPDGLVIELLQASPGAVAQALAVNPRADA